MCNIPKRVLQEEEFANEFLKRDGDRVLVDVISSSHGNTLAVRIFTRVPLFGLTYFGDSMPSRQ
jgi:engulfment/cell motility protein 1